MRERHWKRVREIVGRDFDQNSPEFTLDAIAEMQLQMFADQINELSNAASMELNIELVMTTSHYKNCKIAKIDC